MKRKSLRAFSLIELLIAIAIIGTLATLVIPEFDKMAARSRSIVCTNNLRNIGVGILNYVGENDNTFPMIEPNPEDPVYDPEVKATPLIELEAYGIKDNVLRCPADFVRSDSYFKSHGSSYQWRIILDEENAAAPKIYGGRRGGVRVVKPSRVRICTDYLAVHSGRMNALYADGHVTKPQ